MRSDIQSGVSVFHLLTITKKVCTAKYYIYEFMTDYI